MSKKQVKDALAAALADELNGRVNHPVVPSRRDPGVSLPMTVVVVKRLRETTSRSGAYYAQVRIVHISEVADSTSDAHDVRVEELELAIDAMPHKGKDEARDLILYGFEVEEIEDAVNGEDDVFGDVFVIVAGCGRVKA